MKRARFLSGLFLVLVFIPGCTTGKRTGLENLKEKADEFGKEALIGPQHDESYVVATSQVIDPAGETVVFPGQAR